MITSILYSSFLSMFVAGIPELFVVDCGNNKVVSGLLGPQGAIISVTDLGEGGKREGTGVGFASGDLGSIGCRFAVSSGRLWVFQIMETNSGIVPLGAEITQFNTSELLENRWRPKSAPLKVSLWPTIQSSAAATAAIQSIFEGLTAQYGQGKSLHAFFGSRAWDFVPFWDFVSNRRWERKKLPADVVGCPKATIAASTAKQIIVGLYGNQRVAWFKLEELPLKPLKPKGNTPDQDNLPKSIIGPLSIKGVGVTNTFIDTWATACWIKDAVHLVSDDGKYERFVLKDDKMTPAGRLTLGNPPKAICQGKSKLWSLSEKDRVVHAAEITWNDAGTPSQKERDFGKMSLDEVGWRLLVEDKDSK